MLTAAVSPARVRRLTQARETPLQPGDTGERTAGCRHAQPDNCAKNEMRDVCAFVRTDGMCLSPSARWPKQYRILLARRDGVAPPKA